LKNLSFIKESFTVSPSPFNNVLNISVSATFKRLSVFRLVSMQGKIMFQTQRQIKAGANNLIINLPPVCPGIYIMTMSNDNGVVAIKVLKQ
jgi:hypothetical protein